MGDDIERCADCGHDVRTDLYWHEEDGEWVCEEVSDCKERQTDALRDQLRGAVEAAAELARALRLTQEYVGDELLPPIEGWSWYEALKAHGHYEVGQ